MAFKIDGVTIKSPSSFKSSRYKVTKAERLANASMTMELIGKKLKFYFTYEAITQKDLNVILGCIWDNDECFYELTYDEGGQTKTATVYVGEIPADLHRNEGANSVYKDVTFNLIEK